MFLKTLLMSALVASLGGFGVAAYADIPLTDYTLNFSDAAKHEAAVAGFNTPPAPAFTSLNDVATQVFLAYSVIGFYDNDCPGPGCGAITAGDSFEDYIIGQVIAFSDADGTTITPDSNRQQITFAAEFSGHQTVTGPPGAYVIDNLKQFNVFYNSNSAGSLKFTPANLTNPSSYTDGILVQQGTLIGGGGTNNSLSGPTGTIDLSLNAVDKLMGTNCNVDGTVKCGPWETDSSGQPLAVTKIILDISASNTALYVSPPLGPPGGVPSTPALLKNIITATAAVFPNDLHCTNLNTNPSCRGTAGLFSFFADTQSNGSLTESAPNPASEPASLALMGIGLLGVGALRRRFQRS